MMRNEDRGVTAYEAGVCGMKRVAGDSASGFLASAKRVWVTLSLSRGVRQEWRCEVGHQKNNAACAPPEAPGVLLHPPRPLLSAASSITHGYRVQHKRLKGLGELLFPHQLPECLAAPPGVPLTRRADVTDRTPGECRKEAVSLR